MNHCQHFKTAGDNRLIAELIKVANKLDESLLHECPYSSMMIKNKPLSISNLPSIFSQGEYKITFNFTNQRDEQINFVEFLASIISSEKNSFG